MRGNTFQNQIAKKIVNCAHILTNIKILAACGCIFGNKRLTNVTK